MRTLTSAKPFFDTNVLLYAYRKDDPRSVVAEKLLASGGVIGVQQLNEFASVAKRKLHKPWDQIETALDDVITLCPDPWPLTLPTHRSAVEVATRYGYGIYDAMVISTALEACCQILYSEDMQDGQKIGGLTITNPFAQPN